jgi:hypothetical protein
VQNLCPIHNDGSAIINAAPDELDDVIDRMPGSSWGPQEKLDQWQTIAEKISAAQVMNDAPDEYMCPNCVTPWKCNGPHEIENARLVEWANDAGQIAEWDTDDVGILESLWATSTLGPIETGKIPDAEVRNLINEAKREELIDKTIDPITRPKHYTQHPSGIEPIQITENFNFCLGNAFKYVARYQKKNGIEDLDKAVWYLEREIGRRQVTGPDMAVPLGANGQFDDYVSAEDTEVATVLQLIFLAQITQYAITPIRTAIILIKDLRSMFATENK